MSSLASMLLFSCLLAASTTLSESRHPNVALSRDGNTFWRVVGQDELWRFQVSAVDTDLVNVGTGAVCLYAAHKNFVRAKEDAGPAADREWCREHERFVVAFLQDELVAVRSHAYGTYISCGEDGIAGASPQVGDSEKFALYADAKKERLAIRSHDGQWVSAKSDGRMTCDGAELGKEEQLTGWKGGSKAAWEPYDTLEPLQAFENSKPRRTVQYAYQLPIGYKLRGSQGAFLTVPAEHVAPGREASSLFTTTDFSSDSGISWTAVSPRTWEEAELMVGYADVPPGYTMQVSQAVGFYGTFTFHTDRGFVRMFSANSAHSRNAETRFPLIRHPAT